MYVCVNVFDLNRSSVFHNADMLSIGTNQMVHAIRLSKGETHCAMRQLLLALDGLKILNFIE